MFNALTKYRDYGRLWRVYGRSLFRYGTPKKWLNALRTEWAYRRRRVDVPSKPYLVFVEPLYYCNLHCPLCDREQFPQARRAPGEAGKLPLELYARVLDELGDYLFQCHIFGLGEPLLDWRRTREIIEMTHRRGIYTLVSTNCTPITPGMAREIVASGLDYLVCAIDGVSQEAYARYRVGGKVERALEGMRLVAEERRKQRSGIEIEWQFLVNRFNHHEMDEARRIARELGVYLRFAPLGGMEHDPALQAYWLPDPAETAQWQDARIAAGRTRFGWPCYWLWRACVVNSNGQLARCPGYQSVAQLGSLRDQPVMALYNGPGSQRSRQLYVRGPVPDGPFPSPCATCAFYPRHHGGPPRSKPACAEDLLGGATSAVVRVEDNRTRAASPARPAE